MTQPTPPWWSSWTPCFGRGIPSLPGFRATLSRSRSSNHVSCDAADLNPAPPAANYPLRNRAFGAGWKSPPAVIGELPRQPASRGGEGISLRSGRRNRCDSGADGHSPDGRKLGLPAAPRASLLLVHGAGNLARGRRQGVAAVWAACPVRHVGSARTGRLCAPSDKAYLAGDSARDSGLPAREQ
jgi:hypothetical protein